MSLGNRFPLNTMNKLFSEPIDASAFVAGFGECIGVRLLNINYDGGTDQGYRVQLIRPDESLSSEVVGIPEDSPAEVAAATHCRAYIASRSA